MGQLTAGKKLPYDIKGDINFSPVGDKVLIKEIEEDKVSDGGIVIIQENKSMFRKGCVVAVNEFYNDTNGIQQETGLTIGDTVIFSYLSSTPIRKDDDEYLIVTLPNIFAVVED